MLSYYKEFDSDFHHNNSNIDFHCNNTLHMNISSPYMSCTSDETLMPYHYSSWISPCLLYFHVKNKYAVTFDNCY